MMTDWDTHRLEVLEAIDRLEKHYRSLGTRLGEQGAMLARVTDAVEALVLMAEAHKRALTNAADGVLETKARVDRFLVVLEDRVSVVEAKIRICGAGANGGCHDE